MIATAKEAKHLKVVLDGHPVASVVGSRQLDGIVAVDFVLVAGRCAGGIVAVAEVPGIRYRIAGFVGDDQILLLEDAVVVEIGDEALAVISRFRRYVRAIIYCYNWRFLPFIFYSFKYNKSGKFIHRPPP